jgi:hypothetical protein
VEAVVNASHNVGACNRRRQLRGDGSKRVDGVDVSVLIVSRPYGVYPLVARRDDNSRAEREAAAESQGGDTSEGRD